MPDQDNE
jgi:DMSO/TMAO reductase YedYZ molybdopterin-dependent catalytic subunit